MGDWKTVAIEDVAEDVTVGHVGPMADQYVVSGVPFLRSLSIEPFAVKREGLKFISPEFHRKLRKSALRPGDVVIVRTGKPGACAVIPEWLEEANCSDLVIVRCGQWLRPRFLCYVVNSTAGEHISSHTVGAVQQHFNVGSARTLKFLLPPIDVQDSILGVLGALDDKIELNRRMNETLEAMARAIFKDWFVDFGPTRAKMEGRVPYLAPDIWSLFPDRLDDEGKPEGWSVMPLDEVADFLNGLALQKYPANGGASLPVIKIAQLRAANVASADLASTDIPKDYIVENGDVLFSWSGSLLHRVWTAGRGALNQHLFKVTSRQFPKWFFFHWIAEHMPSFQATAASKATTMGHIQRHHLTQALTYVGTPAVMKMADEVIEPLFNRQIANDLEVRTLAATRDFLLPKLMSGDIRIKDAEQIVGDAA
jgi:type I restriction enzyme S subunit